MSLTMGKPPFGICRIGAPFFSIINKVFVMPSEVEAAHGMY